MIRNYLKIAWRNFYKHKFYTFINVFGLSMGICCSIILFLFISYHLSFDTYHANAKRIYRVVTDIHIPDGTIEYSHGAPLVLGRMLKSQLPEIAKQGVFLNKRSFTVSVASNDKEKQKLFYEKENVAFANDGLFDIFSYNWIAGDNKTALTAPNTAVITSNLAKKYFNTDDAMGKVIRLDDKHNVVITGVLKDIPVNTDIKADLFISQSSVKQIYPEIEGVMNNDWTFVDSKVSVFVLLANDGLQAKVDNSIHTIAKNVLKKEAHVWQYHLEPLADIHFNSHYSDTVSKSLLAVLTLVGIALLLIAGVNFVNMATAQSMTRGKEIGTRKVLGSSRQAIFWQFITETAYVAITATLLALMVVWVFLPVLNGWLQLPLAINGNVFLFLLILLIVLIFSAGFYPAVILSRFKPVNALKNVIDQSRPASKLSRSLLIVTQNAIAQLLIACTLIITLQVKYIKNADLGFNKDAIIMVPIQDNKASGLVYLRNELNNQQGIKNVTFCYSAPTAPTNKGGSIRYDGKDWELFSVNSIIGDNNYLKTFDLKLLAGRNIAANDSVTEFLVNEQFLTKMAIKSPEQALGHQITAGDFDKKGTIVGVVKNFNSLTLYSSVQPLLVAAQPAFYKYTAIKIAGGQQMATINTVKKAWQKVYPQFVFDYRFLDQQIADYYQKEEMINKLIKAGSIVAIAISCMGLLGLISLITVQRTKEIGIRKVLGASLVNITAMLSKDFLKLVIIAVVVASPIAWWIMNKWLQAFAYRIEMHWWLFALAGMLAIVIAFITVSFQAIKAALANPVKSLRSE